MSFGGHHGSPTDDDEAIRIIHRAIDAGINFLDTADMYAESEVVVGKALRGGKRDQVFLATKVHFPTGPGPNDHGNSRLHIVNGIERSLSQLGTDHVDLYQLHRPDPGTPIEETIGTLADLVRQG